MAVYELKGKNKYYTLYKYLRDDILRGKYKSGEKLPSKRTLAEEVGVSVVTVQLAYEQLLAEGYVISRERSGYFVERLTAAPAPAGGRGANKPEKRPQTAETTKEPAFKIDFVKGSAPAGLFPFSVWTKLTRQILADCGEHLLERVPCDGAPELKSALSDYLYRTRGIDADPQRIVIGAGAEYLYGIIVQLLGRDRLFAVENPGYARISAAYALNGAAFTPITVGANGVSVKQLKKSEADVLHISPSHQFPTGAVTPARVRSEIIDWARGGVTAATASGKEKYVIEDDYDSEFRLSGKPLNSLYSLCPERVIYINTFSKSLAPSLRMGYMILPPALYKRYMEIFSSTANVVPLFEQTILAKMIDGGYFERHLSRLKNHYRGIRRAVVDRFAAIAGCEIFDTGSGLHFIAKFKNAQSDDQIKKAAAARGVKIKCLSDYLIAPPEGGVEGVEKSAVINYSGVTLTDIYNI